MFSRLRLLVAVWSFFFLLKGIQMDSESVVWKGNIPIDLINDILLRLPAKAIGRCMLTCKRWYSLVKSPQFITSHLNHSKIKDHRVLIVQEGNYTIFSESDTTLIEEESGKFPFPLMERDLSILGSCRGLVLIRSRVERGWLVLLWNPSLRKSKLIDFIECDGLYGILGAMSSLCCVFALGFHEASNDYRVVRIAGTSENYFSPEVVDVYSLTKDSWHRVDGTLIDGSILPTIAFPERMATYFNGLAHWIANYDQMELDRFVILSFDFDNEVFKVIELLDRHGCYVEEPYSLELKELNGKLSLFGVYPTLEFSTFTWVMMNYPFVDSWTNIDCLFKHEGKHELWPVVCTKIGNCVFRPTANAKHDMLMYYNAKGDKIYDLEVVAPYICPVIADFVESLVLLDAENEVLDGRIP